MLTSCYLFMAFSKYNNISLNNIHKLISKLSEAIFYMNKRTREEIVLDMFSFYQVCHPIPSIPLV